VHISRSTIFFYMALVFTSGLAVGGFGFRLYNNVATVSAKTKSVTRSPEEYRKQSMEELRKKLSLTDQQVAEWNKSLDENDAEIRKVQEETRPLMRALHEKHVARVHSFLSKEQGEGYDKILAERDARQKERRNRGK